MSEAKNLLLRWLNWRLGLIRVFVSRTKFVLQLSAEESWLVLGCACQVFALVWNGIETLSFVFKLALEVARVGRTFHVVVFSVLVG